MYTKCVSALKAPSLTLASILAVAVALQSNVVFAAPRTHAVNLRLDSDEGLKPVNAKIEPVTFRGRKALRVSDTAPEGTSDAGRYVIVTGSDLRTYNGRSEDQLQRNHSAQYISIPEFPWNRLREEFPAKYESYVDLVPNEWIKVKIEVRGEQARLYVHDAQQPTLIVKNLLHGTTSGAVALFISSNSLAHFSNLRVSP